MAGEWIAVDIGLGTKPEIQELIDLTGEPVEVVVYRMLQLWGWASLNSEDGTARLTPARLGRTCGGDERFWQAVETVGWIRFAEDGTAEIPGWGRRFSKAAKSRALHLERAGRARQEGVDGAPRRSISARGECAQAQQKRTREEERTSSSSSSPEDVDVDRDGQTLLAAWSAAARRNPARVQAYTAAVLPEATLDRLAEPGWLAEALAALERLPACRYFTSPVNLPQFSGRKGGVRFTRKVIEQQFDNPRTSSSAMPARSPYRGPDDRPPPQAFSGDDAARFEATKRAIAERLRQEGAA